MQRTLSRDRQAGYSTPHSDSLNSDKIKPSYLDRLQRLQSMPNNHLCDASGEGCSDNSKHEQLLSDLSEEYTYTIQETAAGCESLNIECRRCSDGDNVQSFEDSQPNSEACSSEAGRPISEIDEGAVGIDAFSIVRRGITSDYESSESPSSVGVEEYEDVPTIPEINEVPSSMEDEKITPSPPPPPSLEVMY